LSSCDNPHDYKIPSYEEESMEFDISPFSLNGWIVDEYSEGGLDRFDKLSGQISYPAYRVGKSIADELRLHADNQYRKWCVGDSMEHCMECQNWSYDIAEYGEADLLKGKRLIASQEILRKLCATTGSELIIEVQIRRWIKKSRYSMSGGESAYVPPKHKVYVFSQKGELRNENGCIDIREINC
jgi:hypothetical protein